MTSNPLQSNPSKSLRYSLDELTVLLGNELPQLGHRNWVVITDAAYPLQAHPAIDTHLCADALPNILSLVLSQIEGHNHIRPQIHLDQEFHYVADSEIAGISDFRTDLMTRLQSFPHETCRHEDLIRKMDQAASMYRILLLKSISLFPYSSVFIELQCGYWNEKSEAALQATLRHHHKP